MDDELAILSVPTPAGKSPLSVPPSNTEHVYTAGRAMSFWPVVNGNGATWLEEEISKLYANGEDENLTFKGKLVNIDHSIGRGKGSIIVGVTLKEKYIPGVGVDVLNQLDRRCLDDHGISATDFATNGDYSKQSVEINCDRALSKFIVMVRPNSTNLSDQKIYSADEAATMGIRRGVLHDGFKVVEACVPRRIRGVAMVGNPADTTAQVFDIAAANKEPYGDVSYADPGYQADKKKRYPLDTPEHVRAAASYFGQGKNRDEYTPAQRASIQDKIDAAKKRHGIGDEDAAMNKPSDTYEDSSSLDNAYNKATPMSLSNDDTAGLDDGAFAVVQGGEEVAGVTAPSIRKRELPLYESNKHMYSGIPHKGLIKAALAGLGPDKDGKRAYKQPVHSAALQRVRSAHQQLTGDYSMSLTAEEIAAIADPLKRELATMAEQLRVANDEKASGKTASSLLNEQIALKDTEIATLNAKIKELQDAADEAASEVVAAARLVELAKIDGFTVVDTEKAALVAVLKDESEADFANRVLREENASLKRNIAAGKTGGKATDEQASLDDEHAGLRALNGAAIKLPANSAFAALYK